MLIPASATGEWRQVTLPINQPRWVILCKGDRGGHCVDNLRALSSYLSEISDCMFHFFPPKVCGSIVWVACIASLAGRSWKVVSRKVIVAWLAQATDLSCLTHDNVCYMYIRRDRLTMVCPLLVSWSVTKTPMVSPPASSPFPPPPCSLSTSSLLFPLSSLFLSSALIYSVVYTCYVHSYASLAYTHMPALLPQLFRADLISAMKLPDSTPMEPGSFLTIREPWRTEWEKGVQVYTPACQ